jgi:hypothetical protein
MVQRQIRNPSIFLPNVLFARFWGQIRKASSESLCAFQPALMFSTTRIPGMRALFLAAAILVVLLFFFFHPSVASVRLSQWRPTCPPVEEQNTMNNVLLTPIKRKNVVVASYFAFHIDVYMALVWTLERVTHKAVPVYIAEPFHHGFGDLVQNIGIHNGPLRDSSQLHVHLEKDNTIDMVVFGTCEIECVPPFVFCLVVS